MRLNPKDATPRHTSKQERAPEQISGPFTAVPDAVMSSPAWASLTDAAVRLLLELAYRHDGFNNGNLFASYGQLAKRGMKSHSKVERAFDELVNMGFVVKASEANRLTNQAAHYALTWLPPSATLRDGSTKAMPLLPRPFPMNKYLTVTPTTKEVQLKGKARQVRAAKVAREVSGEDFSTAATPHCIGTTVYCPPGRKGLTEKAAKPIPPGGRPYPAGQETLSRPTGDPYPAQRERWKRFRTARRFDMTRFKQAGSAFHIDRADHAHHHHAGVTHVTH